MDRYELDVKRKKEKTKRKIKTFKLLTMILIFLIIVLYYLNKQVINKFSYEIGYNLTNMYLKDNYTYKYQDSSDENVYVLIKRFNNRIYYEESKKSRDSYVKNIYCYDINKDEIWKVIEDDKVIITNDFVDIKFEKINNFVISEKISFAEKYCISNFNAVKPPDKVLSVKNIKDKRIDKKLCFEINIEAIDGIHKTYFDKDTFIPYKDIVETKNNGKKIYNIYLEFDNVTYEDFKIIDEYKKMTDIDYKEYRRVMGL